MRQNQGWLLAGLLGAGVALSATSCGGGGSSGGGGGVTNPTPTPIPPGGPQVYLTDASGNSSETTPNTILSFSIAGILSGQAVSPSTVIVSPALINIPSIAVDGSKNFYVVDQPSATVYEYAAGSTGSGASPIRTITSTAFSAPYGIAVGSAGVIYVSDPMGGPTGNGAIDVFNSSQNGSVSPVREITGPGSQLSQPYGIALDTTGDVWVTNDANSSAAMPSVLEFGPNSSTPIRVISGASTGLNAPIAIAFDSSSNAYVANAQGNSVTVYSPGTTGNKPPVRVISGSATGISLPQGLAFDVAGNLYVTNLQISGVPGTLNIFSPGASGNPAPIAELSGGSSVTFNPIGVAI
jgi:hypothetical protein